MSAFLSLQWNSSAHVSSDWVHSIVKVKPQRKPWHPTCMVRCVTRWWPLFLCVCTVSRPGAFLPHYSSDESLLPWCLTTGVSTSKGTHTHTYIHSSASTSSDAKGLWECTARHWTQRASERRLNHRGCIPKHKCTVINRLLSDTRGLNKPSRSRIRLYPLNSHSQLVVEKRKCSVEELLCVSKLSLK